MDNTIKNFSIKSITPNNQFGISESNSLLQLTNSIFDLNKQNKPTYLIKDLTDISEYIMTLLTSNSEDQKVIVINK